MLVTEVNAGGGCEAAVTTRTRCWRDKCVWSVAV